MNKAHDKGLTHKRVVELLDYSPETGDFRWRRLRGNAKPDRVAGWIDHIGYRSICIDGQAHRAHRLAWLYVHGSFPDGHIDHKDGNPANNRIENLRIATVTQNRWNSRGRGEVPFTGVTIHKKTGKFQAQFQKRYIGLFATAEDAAMAYDARAKHVYGDFARLNFQGVQT